MSAMTDGLLPCPFCGGRSIDISGVASSIPPIICNDCGGSISPGSNVSHAEMIAAWNRRAPAAAQSEPARKIVQISTAMCEWDGHPWLYVLYDNGELWRCLDEDEGRWFRVPLPQPEIAGRVEEPQS